MSSSPTVDASAASRTLRAVSVSFTKSDINLGLFSQSLESPVVDGVYVLTAILTTFAFIDSQFHWIVDNPKG